MPIIIAKTYDDKVEDIVLAIDVKSANAYWQGKGVVPHSVYEYNESDLDDHMTGVIPILTTRRARIAPFGENAKEHIIVV
jgi:hypothetical protein